MRSNLNPNIWGPHAWFFIDSCILSYPDKLSQKQKKDIKSFFYLLKNILPCEKCRYNYSIHLKEYPLTNNILNSKENILKWIIKMHNLSNNNNNISYNNFYNFYNDKYNDINNKKKYLLLFFIIFIIILCYILSYKKIIKINY
tara:strand:+ start:50 stop:478 length:429 start_codon:yes stop_codon:yes gene_type:complete